MDLCLQLTEILNGHLLIKFESIKKEIVVVKSTFKLAPCQYCILINNT